MCYSQKKKSNFSLFQKYFHFFLVHFLVSKLSQLVFSKICYSQKMLFASATIVKTSKKYQNSEIAEIINKFPHQNVRRKKHFFLRKRTSMIGDDRLFLEQFLFVGKRSQNSKRILKFGFSL